MTQPVRFVDFSAAPPRDNGSEVLASIGLHRLKGDRKGQWAMMINGAWRLVFEFKNGDAYNVEIVDYH